ncbi:hypothetical protein L3Q82_012907 [Scortum barcoo]|uniref:Uncharacterized protein n=1 Tax=Scortum barcoo TaxID=214431 RepID=A0ACB8W2J3_9TELE|nr:hypothetical protein L3Q82_012907 [Scortum barcoo]
MGVQGLVSLLETHQRIYREIHFRKSRLLIDGCNLIYLLYFGSGLDQNHGGEYAAFEALVEKFIQTLRDCEIKPYVVLDGGTDPTDKKLDTLTSRAEDCIRRAHQAAVSGRPERILPQMIKLVFRQTLIRLEVAVAQCFGEADQEIAALASEWECPVLSNDSDFYIFDLPAGLLPISHFQWKAVKRSGSQSYIPCKSYKTSSFCIFFDIQRDLLPTFAALAGNDYVKLERINTTISWSQFCPAGCEPPSRLEGLLCWLKSFDQPHKALQAALGLMGELSKERQAEVLEGLYLGMKEYQIPHSSLKRFFIHGTTPTAEKVEGLVPAWMWLMLTQALLTPDVQDVLLLNRMPLSFTVDHADLPSARLTSRPLRQVMYGLLLGKGKRRQVMERDRDGLQLALTPGPSDLHQAHPAADARLAGQDQELMMSLSLNVKAVFLADPSQRLQVLLEALGVTEASLSRLPPQLRLPVAATCYWLQRAEPPPDERLLKALLLGLSDGGTARQRAALPIQSQRFRQRLDVGVVHSFNQWQGCLKDSIHLNQLLSFPLPEPQMARLYEGTLVHHLVHRMRTGGKLKPFLKSDPSSVRQYRAMLAVAHQFQGREASKSSETQKEPTAPRQKRRQPLDDLTANLQQLFLQYDDDDQEEAALEVRSLVGAQKDFHLDDLVSVRTRYRAKERNNRCNNPELARKEECRGHDLL